MISLLRGNIVYKSLGSVIIDVNGVGYGVTLPLSIFYRLDDSLDVTELKIYTYVKENVLELYGFLTDTEKSVFIRLLSISGIGPKAATNILSNVTAEELVNLIKSGDLIKKKIPGVGPKTATRIVNELKDKLGDIETTDEVSKGYSLLDDVVSALLNLGYTKFEIDNNLKSIEDIINSTNDIELALRDSIKIMKKE
ncbi:MAG: Holliday junction branch migration protein RuvA [Candidatus Dadabacteria bacterium]|nr:Holliday junction branch migration protein RuvA [Candidatus Dadabacteria bacterium]NIQ14058.1 Holliday junction branch migration protein RuvA [Candidatus Dadabacteria bacterium]